LEAYYTSYKEDTGAVGVNAFDFYWHPKIMFYANPPWTLIERVLEKIIEDKATVVLVTPRWTKAPWWSQIIEMKVTQIIWTGPLYLDVDLRVRPKPHWDTAITCVSALDINTK